MKSKKTWKYISVNDHIITLLSDLKSTIHLKNNDIIWMAIDHFKDNYISEEEMITFMKNYPTKKITKLYHVNISYKTFKQIKKIKESYKINLFLYQILWVILLFFKHKTELYPNEITQQDIKQYNNWKKFIETIDNFNEKEQNETK